MLPDDRDRLSGRNVVARGPVFVSRDTIEVRLQNLLSPRQPIAPTHNEIMADVSLWENILHALVPVLPKTNDNPCGAEFQSIDSDRFTCDYCGSPDDRICPFVAG